MGVSDANPLKEVGYIPPREWNRLIRGENTLLIDTHNDYECAVGTFIDALNPKIKTFRELPHWIREHSIDLKKKEKIAMFCTGGIRCEKSTAYMRSLGFDHVYHREEFLNILKKYLKIKAFGKEDALFLMNEYLSVMDISKVQL